MWHQGETIDWLEDLGLDFDPACPGLIHGHEVFRIQRTYWAIGHGRTLLKVLTGHLQPLVDSGQVTVSLRTRAQRLLRAAAVTVTGVAWRSDHADGLAAAPAVVLATGGYDANRKLRDSLLPDDARARSSVASITRPATAC